MPVFEIETPQGKFQVDAPDENAAIQALQGEQSQPAEWSANADADAAEKLLGTGTFSDMTNSGMAKAIPFGDEIVSGLNAIPRAAREWWQGDGFDVPRAYDRNTQVEAELQKRREDRSPIASTVGAVAGGVGASAPLAAGGLSFLNGAKPTLLSMATRGASEGAAYGAAYGAGEGRGVKERIANALWSGGIGAATGGLTGAVSGALASRGANGAVPSVDDLRAAGQAAYQQADQAGVIFTPDAVSRLKTDVGKKLVDMGYDPALQPGAAAIVKRIDDLAGQNVTLTGLDSLRKVASNGYIPGNKSNNKAIGDIISSIDDLVSSPGAGEVLSGDAQAAASALKTARDMWSRVSKAERVSDALERADLRASSTGSGGNVDNATRQNLRRILEKPRGFTEAEKAALEKVVRGTPTQNALRLAGKLSPSGNGLMAALGVGGAMVNPLIGLASLGGMGAKAAADGMTQANAAVLDALIRNGGVAPSQALSPITKAIVQALTHGAAASP